MYMSNWDTIRLIRKIEDVNIIYSEGSGDGKIELANVNVVHQDGEDVLALVYRDNGKHLMVATYDEEEKEWALVNDEWTDAFYFEKEFQDLKEFILEWTGANHPYPNEPW